jgi:hypothetical protein
MRPNGKSLTKLCDYAKISLEEDRKIEVSDYPELLATISDALDGTPERARRLARMIKSLSPLLK